MRHCAIILVLSTMFGSFWALAQDLGAHSSVSGQDTTQGTSPPDPFAADAGTWVGIGAGFHSGDGTIYDRKGLVLGIELRTKSPASFLLEYQRWWYRERHGDYFVDDYSGWLAGGIKGRMPFGAVAVFGELGLWFPGDLGTFGPWCAAGIEIPISEVVRPALQVGRYSFSSAQPVFIVLKVNVRN